MTITEGDNVRHVNNERTGRVLAVSLSGMVAVEWADGTVALVHPVWLEPTS